MSASEKTPPASDPKALAPEVPAPKPLSPKPLAPKVLAPKLVSPKPLAPKVLDPKPVSPKPPSPKPSSPKPSSSKPVASKSSELKPSTAPPPKSPELKPPTGPAPKAKSLAAQNPELAASGKHTVHWFRKGLRLHDNPALREGLRNATTYRCIFIIDPWFANLSNVSINKWRFLLQCLEDLDKSLRKLKSRLFVVRGQPADVLPKLFKEWGTTCLTFEEDPEPFARIRDHKIVAKCREVGITVVTKVSHTLYKLDKIIERNGGKAPLTYHQFQALIATMPPMPGVEQTICESIIGNAVTPSADKHEDRFAVPTLEELGFESEKVKPPVWIGGETEGLIRLDRHLERKAWVASFGRPKMTPQSLFASDTGLSPYLRFGCLSTRLFYYQLTELYKRIKKTHPPLSLHGQILWREFLYCAATRNPNFDRMEGNPICVHIPWEKDDKALAKWANGQTGFPWIDAIMTQLREEGWIHHLARHAVASFLTRGDLWISWEEGMKVFDELLLDADWSVNAGMWMWLSGSSFFQQFYHSYCPVRFGRKTDKNGDFIRRYIPALKNMPTCYIHEPWMAPESVQIAARCTIGKDYPMPMVDHELASQLNIERIKQVYANLAKFKPLTNQQAMPLVYQSSVNPTIIITSINQTNYLCQVPPQPVPTPYVQSDPSKDISIVCKRTKELRRIPKPPLFKEIVIVEPPQNVNLAPSNATDQQQSKDYLTNQQGTFSDQTPDSFMAPPKQENFDYKNLVYDNVTYANPCEVYDPPSNQTEMYQQVVKLNVGFDPPRFHLPMYPGHVQQMSYAPVPEHFNPQEKCSTSKEKEDPGCLHPINMNTDADGAYNEENYQNSLPNEDAK